MYLSSLFLTLALSLTSTVVVVRGNPAPSSNSNSLSNLLLAPRADCGPINGNCYDNGCDGDKSSDGLHCISGEYAGCPCGYGCNKNYVGPCDAFGCNGVNNDVRVLMFECFDSEWSQTQSGFLFESIIDSIEFRTGE
ncbi:hypothetical protein F5050DRAFT_1710556 [Lentinula boryana]|uniref:Uncharacterized protein n=1 Tax=Lentinula boryana TaxID=40481 RepID=A0ABQ8QIM5_9AGAR|nr:hypothetical protein F5050DRAFT_1710556 [Lentinula boryana]